MKFEIRWIPCLPPGARDVALPACAGEEVDKDGVLHVMNGAKPSEGNETVELEEVWRHGGEDDEEFFGMISQCVVGDDGTIYLLDTRMSEVPVYSPDGERLDTLSREGDGPGRDADPLGPAVHARRQPGPGAGLPGQGHQDLHRRHSGRRPGDRATPPPAASCRCSTACPVGTS